MEKIFIVDDDINVRKMLEYLIVENSLGKVVGECKDGYEATDYILLYKPDIVLIDYLMPGKVGIEIIKECKNKGYNGKFIMISQVEDRDMIGKAYNEGAMFFINKPLNMIEVKSIIKNVIKTIELEKSVEMIKKAISFDQIEETKKDVSEEIIKIFRKLGISSEFGVDDLKKLIIQVIKYKKKKQSYQLKELYLQVIDDKIEEITLKSLEQRIRRIIYKALQNIAVIGNEDIYNPIFLDYAKVLFDIGEVRLEMFHLEDGTRKGKISIRKFIEGMANHAM